MPDCACHGVPMCWNRDARRKAGGYWRCREARKPHDARRKANLTADQRSVYDAQRRARYDTDPVYRITKRLHDDARSRAATLARQRKRLEGADGLRRATATKIPSTSPGTGSGAG